MVASETIVLRDSGLPTREGIRLIFAYSLLVNMAFLDQLDTLQYTSKATHVSNTFHEGFAFMYSYTSYSQLKERNGLA